MSDPLIFGSTIPRPDIREDLCPMEDAYRRSLNMLFMGIPLRDLSHDELLGIAVHYYDMWETTVPTCPKRSQL